MSLSRRHFPAVFALALALGCASGEAARRDLDALRAEVRALRQENEALSRKVDALGGRVEALSARSRQAAPAAAGPATPAPAAPAPSASPGEAVAIPEGLAVVKVPPARPAGKEKGAAPPATRGRAPPPVATAVTIAEPDPDRLEAIGARPSGGLGAAADAELGKARAQEGADRAHALEDFSARYPRHPAADNALVEAATAYADAGKGDAACALARRATEDYPAGDAMSEGLERLAWCEARRGAAVPEQQLLERIVTEYPRTPAARRAGVRLSALATGASAPVPAPSQRSDP